MDAVVDPMFGAVDFVAEVAANFTRQGEAECVEDPGRARLYATRLPSFVLHALVTNAVGRCPRQQPVVIEVWEPVLYGFRVCHSRCQLVYLLWENLRATRRHLQAVRDKERADRER